MEDGNGNARQREKREKIIEDSRFIQPPENPRLQSLGMNGTRSEAETNHLSGPKPRGFSPGRGFIDSRILLPHYGLVWWRVFYFLGISFVLIFLTFIVYKKKDILV